MAAKKIFELKSERAKLVNDARVIADEAAELRSLPADKQEAVDRILAAVDELDQVITRAEKIDALDATLSGTPERRSASAHLGRTSDPTDLYGSEEYRSAFAGWLGSGTLALPAEFRDLTLAAPANGGALVTPVQLAKDIIMDCGVTAP